MTGHPDDGLPLYAQIANLEHRLAFLREKRETLLKQGRIIKRASWVTLVLAAVLVPCLVLTTQADPVPALFVATVLLGACAMVLWIYRHKTWVADPSRKLPGRNRYTFYPTFVEESIKEHERRLAELKAKS